jgi:hypothetical protein
VSRITATSLFRFSTWVTEFIKRRGLSKPDQRPLYEYQATTDEYLDLKRLISDVAHADGFSRDSAACACFSLFCAEWYRREYLRQDGWSWEGIWQLLGFQFSAQELAKIVPRGLDGYWKRPIRFYESERRNFLGSLFSEGGLPFLLLKDSDSRFQALFSRILKHYDQAKLLGLNTTQLIEQQIVKANLPQAFSEDTSVELIAAMADELVSLVRLYDLSTSLDPVMTLETKNPNWRQSFPIPLDDETGSELLNGLLKAASKESITRKSASNGWNSKHFWTEEQPEFLKVQVSMPAEVIFSLNCQAPTTRFDIAIAEGDRPIVDLGAGHALIENNKAKVRLRKREVIFNRRNYDTDLFLVAMAGGMIIASIRIENSSVSFGEVPIGFECINERWVLCGQASFSAKSEEVLIVLPDEVHADSFSQIAIAGPIVCSKSSIKVIGKSEFNIEADETYRIRTGLASASGMLLDLEGLHLAFPTKPSLVFLGLPKVKWKNSDEALACNGSDLFFSGKAQNACVLQELLGVQYLSVRNNNNESLLRRKVGILPTDFKLELKSGDKPSQGSILLYGNQTCITHVLDESISVKRIKHADHIEIKLESSGLPPAKFQFEITPNLLGDPVQIEVPFPSSGCLAFDADSNPLKKDISVKDLLGSRVYLFGRNGIPTKFELELRLRSNSAKHAHFIWSYTASDKPLEISLFNIRGQIEDLLSLQAGIDQIVELRINGNGQDSYYRISKHSTQMKMDYDRQVLFTSNLKEQRSISPEPVLMLLHEPERKPTPLIQRLSDGVPTGEYELPTLVQRNGPWIVIPKQGSGLSFRPLFIVGNSFSNNVGSLSDVQSLQKAVLAFDHKMPISSFTAVLDAMAINPMHSGWHFLHALYEQFGYMPLATFEVWKAVIAHPRALAMALFKFEMKPEFLSRLELEFPVFWEFMSFADIKLIGQRFSSFLKIKGVPEESVERLVAGMYSKLADVFPAYGGEVQSYLSTNVIGPEAKLPLEIFKNISFSWYQDLIREHCDCNRPQFGSHLLKAWFESQKVNVIGFEPEDEYRSVVYLPVFAAAVASGKASYAEVFGSKDEAIFFLRRVRDFDSGWFNSIYQYCLLSHTKNNEKEAVIHD